VSIRRLALVASVFSLVVVASAQDVPFLESPEYVVEAMLDLAAVDEHDVVYDLGSGDGRIVIAAAMRMARGVGIEFDPDLVRLSDQRAREAGVEDRVRFIEGDLFEADFSEATVVAIFLYPDVNRKLRPLLSQQLAPGTRVVSHRYEIDGWEPVERIKVGGRKIFLYRTPTVTPSRGAIGSPSGSSSGSP
jgi:SAM-dependent methyltransferase